MLINYFIAIIVVIVNIFLAKFLVKGKWWVVASVLFLLISPWFIQLLISGIEFWWSKPLITRGDKFIESLIINSSTDYLFFKGDPRVNFGTQETGLFYIFQIPLIILGFYNLFKQRDNYKRILFGWLSIGFLLASFFTAPDFSNGLFYFLPLQLISFLGLSFLFRKWQNAKRLQKGLLILFLLFAVYEIVIFFHILIVHYPKRLMSL